MDEKLTKIIEDYRSNSGTLISILQDVQRDYRYLPEEIMTEVAEELDVAVSRLFSLATFYSGFRLEPMGDQHICACVGTACHVRGAPLLVDTIERELNIKSGDTTEDGKITFDTVNCVGACALGPLVTVDGEFHGNLNQKKVKKLLADSQKAVGA